MDSAPKPVGGDPRSLKRASKLIHWVTVAAVIVALATAWHITAAKTLHSRVVGAHDGDTITVLDANHQ
jgi:hypothetical protein